MRRFFTPRWLLAHVLVVGAVLVCLRLAWWQLGRSEQVDGTAQNLGYALLWPAFGVAFVYMWVRFLRLEAARDEAVERQADESLDRVLAEAESLTAESAPHPPGAPGVAAAQPSRFVGIVGDEDEDDPELIAYNRALAALAEKDRRAR